MALVQGGDPQRVQAKGEDDYREIGEAWSERGVLSFQCLNKHILITAEALDDVKSPDDVRDEARAASVWPRSVSIKSISAVTGAGTIRGSRALARSACARRRFGSLRLDAATGIPASTITRRIP